MYMAVCWCCCCLVVVVAGRRFGPLFVAVCCLMFAIVVACCCRCRWCSLLSVCCFCWLMSPNVDWCCLSVLFGGCQLLLIAVVRRWLLVSFCILLLAVCVCC